MRFVISNGVNIFLSGMVAGSGFSRLLTSVFCLTRTSMSGSPPDKSCAACSSVAVRSPPVRAARKGHTSDRFIRAAEINIRCTSEVDGSGESTGHLVINPGSYVKSR